MNNVHSVILIFLLLIINIQCTQNLVRVSKSGDEKKVQELLDDGVDVNKPDDYYGTAINQASQHGHIEIVKLLLEKGANPNEGIHAAAYSGNVEIVKLLLEKGANINSRMNNIYMGWDTSSRDEVNKLTPLAFMAFQNYNIKMANYLLNNGADIIKAIDQLNQLVNFFSQQVHNSKHMENAKLAASRLEEFNFNMKNVQGNGQNRLNKNFLQVKKYYGQKQILAVMDFVTKDVSQSTAFNVSELIRTQIVNTNKYTVIERSQMREILKEQGFQQTGCTETACAVQVGKLLSAKKILIGSVMKIGNNIVISGRVVDVEKGIIEVGATGKTNSINELDYGVIEFINNLTSN